MHDPDRSGGFPRAAQRQAPRKEPPSALRAFSACGKRVTAAVLGVALLGAASAVREFDIGIVGRRVEGGTSTLRVKRGETVLLRWRTDEAVSLHLHGYDVRVEVSPGSTGAMRFEAGVAGRFPVTAHEFGVGGDPAARAKRQRELTLLYLEVLPE